MNNIRPLKRHDEQHHNAVTRVYAEKMLSSFRERMNEAERLADELNDLLASYQSTIEHEGMRSQVETLTRWAERYRHGLLAADKVIRNGHDWLVRLNDRLTFNYEELGRLEGEGGRPVNKHHVRVQTEDFAAAAQQVGTIASRIEHLFGRPASKILYV